MRVRPVRSHDLMWRRTWRWGGPRARVRSPPPLSADVRPPRMGDWLLDLSVVWMGALILGTIYLATAGLYVVVTRLAVGDRARSFKAISPGILPPLAIIFALLV